MEHERREARVARGRVGLGRRAFTLIELLVVIAVISVLASLLMPVTVRAIAEGQKTQCKSNLNQLGHGISIYGNNFVQELPPFGYWTLGASPGYRSPFWSETMAEFLYPNLPRNERLHKAVRCPLE